MQVHDLHKEAEELMISVKKPKASGPKFPCLALQYYLDWDLEKTADASTMGKAEFPPCIVTEKLQGNCQLVSALYPTLCINTATIGPPRKCMANSKIFYSYFKLFLMKWVL